MTNNRQVQLNALKLISNSLRGRDFIIDPMDEEELKTFFDTITGALLGMGTVLEKEHNTLYQVILETVEQLSLR